MTKNNDKASAAKEESLSQDDKHSSRNDPFTNHDETSQGKNDLAEKEKSGKAGIAMALLAAGLAMMPVFPPLGMALIAVALRYAAEAGINLGISNVDNPKELKDLCEEYEKNPKAFLSERGYQDFKPKLLKQIDPKKCNTEDEAKQMVASALELTSQQQLELDKTINELNRSRNPLSQLDINSILKDELGNLSPPNAGQKKDNTPRIN